MVFVNTRSQAERTFQELWAINDNNLPFALLGSLALEQRRKVEAAMAKGSLRRGLAVDAGPGHRLGAVDKVICIGAPRAPRPAGAAHRPRQSPAG
ncbi:MAG: hypothetical protein U1E93_09250 [Alphaproteobacteria bacterium]